MSLLSIKVPIRKKSGNLFNDPRIYSAPVSGTNGNIQKTQYNKLQTINKRIYKTYVTFRPLVKQTTTRNLYITLYIYFLDGRLCEVGAVRRGIRIVRR